MNIPVPGYGRKDLTVKQKQSFFGNIVYITGSNDYGDLEKQVLVSEPVEKVRVKNGMLTLIFPEEQELEVE